MEFWMKIKGTAMNMLVPAVILSAISFPFIFADYQEKTEARNPSMAPLTVNLEKFDYRRLGAVIEYIEQDGARVTVRPRSTEVVIDAPSDKPMYAEMTRAANLKTGEVYVREAVVHIRNMDDLKK